MDPDRVIPLGFGRIDALRCTPSCTRTWRFRTFIGTVLLLHLLFVAIVDYTPKYDDAKYLEFGQRIAEGKGYTREDGRPTAFWSAGYPYTLGAIFSVAGASIRAAQCLNLVALLAAVLLVRRIVLLLAGDDALAKTSACLFASIPSLAAYSAAPMTELPFLATVLGATYLYLSGNTLWRPIAAGFLFGYATLLRSQALLFPLVVAVPGYLAQQGHRPLMHELRRVGVTFIACVLVLTPLLLRNQRVFGVSALSTNGGVLFAIGNNPVANGGYMHPSQFAASLGESEIARDFAGTAEVERAARLQKASLAWISKNPAAALSIVPRKIWLTFRSGLGVVNWVRDGIGRERSNVLTGYEAYRWACQGYYVVLLLAGIVGTALAVGSVGGRTSASDRHLLPVLAVLGIGYQIGLNAVFFGNARYAVSTYPYIAIGAALFIQRVRKRSGGEPASSGKIDSPEAGATETS